VAVLRTGRILLELAVPGQAVERQTCDFVSQLPATAALPTRRLLNKLSTVVVGLCLNAHWSHLITRDGSFGVRGLITGAGFVWRG
jgi:hypothetical protein